AVLRSSIHAPAMTNEERLARECIRGECREQKRNLSDIRNSREFLVNGLAEHNLFHHLLFGDVEILGLLRDLLLDKGRADKAGTNDVGPDAVLRPFLRDNARKTKQ